MYIGAQPTSSAAIVAALATNSAVWPDGNIATPGAAFAAEPGAGFFRAGSGQVGFAIGNTYRINLAANQLIMRGSHALGWASADPTSADLLLARDAANTLAQRNGANAQVFRLYNTFTDAANYERLAIGPASGTYKITAEWAGTGSPRPLWLSHGSTVVGLEDSANPGGASVGIYRNGTSASTIFSVGSTGLTNTAILHTRLMPSINQASGSYTVVDINPTETAIGAGPHYLIRGRVGAGGNIFEVTNTGNLFANNFTSSASGYVGASGQYVFRGSATGKVKLTNFAETVGLLLDVSTDSLIRLRNRADGADAGVQPQYVLMEEVADPSAPAANRGILYTRDNGSGKTQLVVRFPTGAIQVIATEP